MGDVLGGKGNGRCENLGEILKKGGGQWGDVGWK